MPQPHAHLTSGKQHGVAVSPRGQPLHLLKQVCAAALPHPALAGGCGSPHGANFWQLATHQASSHGPAGERRSALPQATEEMAKKHKIRNMVGFQAFRDDDPDQDKSQYEYEANHVFEL